MKNHYKIHAQHNDNIDHEKDEGLITKSEEAKRSNESQSLSKPSTAFRVEMLDWLRSDFDQFDLGSMTSQISSDRVIRSMKKLRVEEDDEVENNDWIHLE